MGTFVIDAFIKRRLTEFYSSMRATAERAGVVGSDDAGSVVELSDVCLLPD